MNIIISACLFGSNCRYDGTGEMNPIIAEQSKKHTFIPVCPEVLGGMETPRIPSEIIKDKVLNKIGEDVTGSFMSGAEETLKLAKQNNCKYAILKDRSPSCGYGTIYDGTFSKTLIPGNGFTANLLAQNGIKVVRASDMEWFFNTLDNM